MQFPVKILCLGRLDDRDFVGEPAVACGASSVVGALTQLMEAVLSHNDFGHPCEHGRHSTKYKGGGVMHMQGVDSLTAQHSPKIPLIRDAARHAAIAFVIQVKAANVCTFEFPPHWAIRIVKGEAHDLVTATDELPCQIDPYPLGASNLVREQTFRYYVLVGRCKPISHYSERNVGGGASGIREALSGS